MKRSPLLPIFLIVLVDVLGLTIILPLLPFYAERFGASPQVVGLLAATYAICQLVSGPILGQLSDRYGRRPLLLVSQCGTFAGFLLLAQARSLPLVFFSRMLDGATAGNLSIAQAYISDVSKPEDRAKSFAVIGIAFGIGFLIGPAVSGYLSQYGYAVPIYAAAGLSALSITATATLLPAGPPPRAPGSAETGPGGRRLGLLDWGAYAAYFRRPALGALLLQFFCFALSFAFFTSGFAMFAERRLRYQGRPFGPKEVGYLFAYVGLLGIFIQGGLLGRLVKRYGEAALVLSGFVCAAAGYAVVSQVSRLGLVAVAATLTSFGNGVLRPSLTSSITQVTGRSEQGVVLGLTQSIMSVAQIVGPLVGGALIERGHLAGWGLFAAGVSAAGAALALGRRQPAA